MQRSCAYVNSPYKLKCWTNLGALELIHYRYGSGTPVSSFTPMWIRRLIHCMKSAYYVTSFLTISLFLFFSDSYHMARVFVELELFFVVVALFTFSTLSYYVLSILSGDQVQVCHQEEVWGQLSGGGTAQLAPGIPGPVYDQLRFRPVAELVPATSVSGQLRNCFRPLPFPASCGPGSGHFRYRPAAALVPATSVIGQLRNWLTSWSGFSVVSCCCD